MAEEGDASLEDVMPKAEWPEPTFNCPFASAAHNEVSSRAFASTTLRIRHTLARRARGGLLGVLVEEELEQWQGRRGLPQPGLRASLVKDARPREGGRSLLGVAQEGLSAQARCRLLRKPACSRPETKRSLTVRATR
eukprot:scaffold503_cov365-Prasinococcus_capsulatus_cf.AAC.16